MCKDSCGCADTPAISIIVPVYNKGKYVQECLRHLTAQSLDNIEIVVVDDASTDNSMELITDVAQKDQRIRVISHPGKQRPPSSAHHWSKKFYRRLGNFP